MLKEVLLASVALFLPVLRRPAPLPIHIVDAPVAPPDPVPIALAVPEPSSRPLRRINTHEAILQFADFMRASGFVGWMPPEDVDEAYLLFCDDEGLEPMNLLMLRELFANKKLGVIRERKRLRNTTDPHLLRIRRRIGLDRAILYRVASTDEMQLRTPDAKRTAAAKRKRMAPISLTTELPMQRAA